MRKLLDNDLLTLISRLFIGGVFIYASFYKIIEPASFAKSIWYYHMVPGSLINQLDMSCLRRSRCFSSLIYCSRRT